jgi:hypothetical protein
LVNVDVMFDNLEVIVHMSHLISSEILLLSF